MSSTRESSEASPEKKDLDDPRRRELELEEQESLYSYILCGRTQDVYNRLLRSKIHPDAKVSGVNLLSRACGDGNSDVLEFLIMNGADLEGEDRSPLCRALGSSEAKEKCAELLVRHKADVNARDYLGFTLLMNAGLMSAGTCSKTTLKLLLEHQADVHATKWDKTALDFAGERGRLADPEVIALFEAAATRSLRK